jgi:hypothetical protein
LDRARLRRDLENYGIGRSMWRRIGNVAQRVLGLEVYMVSLRRDDSRSRRQPVPEGVEGVDLSVDEVRDLVATRPDLTLSPEYVEAAYARGDVCRVAIRDGEVLGYMWRSTNGFTPHVDHVWITYPPGSYYASTAFVTPAARGAKTMRVLSRAIPTIMAEQGLHKQFGITALHNLSTRSGRKHPWSKRRDDGTLSNDIGYAGYVRRGGHAWCFHSPGVAREGFRVVATPWTAPGGPGADGLGRESGSAALPGAVEHQGAAAADAIGAGTVHG